MTVVGILVSVALLVLGRKLFWLFVGAVGFVAGALLATRLLGGPGRPTTLGEERQDNPFVQEILESSR